MERSEGSGAKPNMMAALLERSMLPVWSKVEDDDDDIGRNKQRRIYISVSN